MIIHKSTVRVAGDHADALKMARRVTDLVNELGGIEQEVIVRVGGFFDIVWMVRFENMAELDAWLNKWQPHPEYVSMASEIVERGLFDVPSAEASIWRTID